MIKFECTLHQAKTTGRHSRQTVKNLRGRKTPRGEIGLVKGLPNLIRMCLLRIVSEKSLQSANQC